MFSENLYLTTDTARSLYDKYAKDLPIIDFHCHLSPREICENRRFSNIGELWLAGDHYKWRAMRAFGIDENLITGSADWKDKFYAFAKILPELAGNPLYIWCALELKRYFDIDEPLCKRNADKIYDQTSAMIAERDIKPSYIINQSNVEFIATTDDPADDLSWHKQIAESDAYGKCRIVPAFRPDKAMGIEKPGFAEYIRALGDSAGIDINSFGDMLEALELRLVAFKDVGAMLNDNALTGFVWADYTNKQIRQIFKKALETKLRAKEINMYRSAFLYEMAKLYAKHGFTAQYHIGAYRNVNATMFEKLGPDTGYDSVDDAAGLRAFGALLDRLNSAGCLPRTIIYPLDINQYEAFATLAANFCGNYPDAQEREERGGSHPGEVGRSGADRRGWVQLGAPWWFNDQYYGIIKQFESVGSLYPVALSIGMLTDSRSFLSYPRHELYRRALCGYLGALVDRGEYFSCEEALGKIIRSVCYGNAKQYLRL